MRRLAATLLLFWLGAVAASAEQLTIALSTGDIRIDSDFAGSAIAVFGVIERDAATVSRGAAYDVAVVVRGPAETVVARRKEPLLFLWVNRSSETFRTAPSFYSVSSTRPLDEIATPSLLKRLGLGFDNIALASTGISPSRRNASDFRSAFIRLRVEAGLFSELDGGVSFIGNSDTVFRSSAWIPSNAPDGRYTVEVYLFAGNVFLAKQQATLNVTKVGFEQFMFASAHDHALLYGLACIGLALFAGWLAGVIFRRE